MLGSYVWTRAAGLGSFQPASGMTMYLRWIYPGKASGGKQTDWWMDGWMAKHGELRVSDINGLPDSNERMTLFSGPSGFVMSDGSLGVVAHAVT